MSPPFSSSDYFETSNISANSVNSSHILNATIIGSDIATGTITNANFVDGAITETKLSSALVAKLEDFDTRLTALENATPPANTGWYGNLYIVNQNIGGGGRYFTFNATDATGTINIISEELGPGITYTKTVLIGNRLPNMSSVITFEITEFQQDSAGYEGATIIGADYSGYLYSGPAYITADSAGTNITINIPVDNDT